MTAQIPYVLIGIRLLCAPAIVVAALRTAPGAILAATVAIAFLSDIFDGVIARRLGVATPMLRLADSSVDMVFYAAAAVALWIVAPGVLRSVRWGAAMIVALETARLVVEHAKFGRMAAYHMWSAKAWGATLILAFGEAFLTGAAGPLVALTVIWGVLSDLEGLAASIVFSTWHHDVPTIWHAIRMERAARLQALDGAR